MMQMLDEWGPVMVNETTEDLKVVAEIGKQQQDIKKFCVAKEDELKELIRTSA